MLAGHMCRPLSPYLSAMFIKKGISPNTVTLMMMCRPLSPYLSAMFIKKGISPNTVTLMMIGWGVLGSALFAIPCL